MTNEQLDAIKEWAIDDDPCPNAGIPEVCNEECDGFHTCPSFAGHAIRSLVFENAHLQSELANAKEDIEQLSSGIADRMAQSVLAEQLSEEIDAKVRLRSAFNAFRREWANRFGFLQTEYPADSIESMDAVADVWATLLDAEREKTEDLKARFMMEKEGDLCE